MKRLMPTCLHFSIFAPLKPSFLMLTPDDTQYGENQYQTTAPQTSVWQNGWATLTIIGINVAVFVLMAINGVNIMQPQTQDLLTWGANFKPLTLDGEWWRLLTACFLHIGILHLAINMYSLFNVGILLENMLGRAQYIMAYLVCGLAGSAASLWWHEATVSAGASGAIFGMFGLFYAWVTTSHLISSEEKKAQLTSGGTFLVFNLVMGLSGRIDNAAHLGGLVAGIIIGLFVSKWQDVGRWRPLLVGCIITSIMAAVLIANSKSDVKTFQDKIKELSVIEESVNQQLAAAQLIADKPSSAQAYKEMGAEWAKATAIAHEIYGYQLPGTMHAFTVHLVDYCEKRGTLFTLLEQAATDDSVEKQTAIDSLNTALNNINKQIENLSK